MNINQLLIPFTLSLLVSCSDNSSLCHFEKVESKLSHDKSVEAVIMKKNCGATTSDAYHVFISSADDVIDEENPIFISDKTTGLKISWAAEHQLLITYDAARIFKFVNFWYPNKSGADRQLVSIIEVDSKIIKAR